MKKRRSAKKNRPEYINNNNVWPRLEKNRIMLLKTREEISVALNALDEPLRSNVKYIINLGVKWYGGFQAYKDAFDAEEIRVLSKR